MENENTKQDKLADLHYQWIHLFAFRISLDSFSYNISKSCNWFANIDTSSGSSRWIMNKILYNDLLSDTIRILQRKQVLLFWLCIFSFWALKSSADLSISPDHNTLPSGYMQPFNLPSKCYKLNQLVSSLEIFLIN